MEVIQKRELNKILKSISYYDFDTNISQSGKVLIQFKDDVTTYSDIVYGGRKENFDLQANFLKKIIMEIISFLKLNSIIAIKYQSSWVNNKRCNLNLVEWLSKNKIRLNFSGALKLNEKNVIEDLIMANFEYNSFTHFLIPESQIIITPTDHMDIFISSNNFENIYEVVYEIIRKIDNNKELVVRRIVD